MNAETVIGVIWYGATPAQRDLEPLTAGGSRPA